MLIDETVFGEAMRRLRGKKTQREACRRGRIPSVTNWSHWESGKSQPQRSQLKRILRGLGCSKEDLEVEIWKVQTKRLRSRGLIHLVVETHEDGLLPLERLWELEFSELSPDARKQMGRMRSRITAIWETILTTQLEPLIADFETLTKALHGQPVQKAENRDSAQSFDHKMPQGPPLSELSATLLAERRRDRTNEEDEWLNDDD